MKLPFPAFGRSFSDRRNWPAAVDLAIFAVVIGHILMAITHRDALRSIFKGWVSEQWAAVHASRWLTETRDGDGSPDAR